MFEKGLLSFWWDFVDKINALVHNTKSNINLGEVIKYKNTLKYKYELNLTHLVTYTWEEIVIALSLSYSLAVYLTIIPWARVGYEMVNCQRVAYSDNDPISNKRE